MDTENYISPSKITKQYDITSGTLRRWSEAGKIRCIRPNGGKRIYNIQDIKKIFNSDNNDPNGSNAELSKNKFVKLLDDIKNNGLIMLPSVDVKCLKELVTINDLNVYSLKDIEKYEICDLTL